MENRENRGVVWLLLVAVFILVMLPLFGMVVMLMMGMSGMLTAAHGGD